MKSGVPGDILNMKPADELKAEHRLIGKALHTLSKLSKTLEDDQSVPLELLREELDFIVNFADKCHHKKEEAILFPILENQLISVPNDPVPQMLDDHEKGRTLIKSLAEAVDKFAAGDRRQRNRISTLINEYTQLLICHIRRENQILVRLIERMLPADQKLVVAERFEAIEEDLGPDYHQKYTRLADKLQKEGRKLAA